MKKIIIIHGWGGFPDKGWFNWIESELKKKGLTVIKPEMPGKDDPEYVAFEAGAQEIASRAKSMVKENKALDFNAAITRATIESKTAGDWQAMKAKDERNFLQRMVSDAPEDVPNARFRGRGARAVDAVEMPKTKAELKSGSYYVTPRGIAKWDGSQFVKDE